MIMNFVIRNLVPAPGPFKWPSLSLVPFKGPKKSWAPQKVSILCRDNLESLNRPHLMIWQVEFTTPRHIYSTVAIIVISAPNRLPPAYLLSKPPASCDRESPSVNQRPYIYIN